MVVSVTISSIFICIPLLISVWDRYAAAKRQIKRERSIFLGEVYSLLSLNSYESIRMQGRSREFYHQVINEFIHRKEWFDRVLWGRRFNDAQKLNKALHRAFNRFAWGMVAREEQDLEDPSHRYFKDAAPDYLEAMKLTNKLGGFSLSTSAVEREIQRNG